MRFKTAKMATMAVIAVSLAIPLAASGFPNPGRNPATHRGQVPALSPAAKIEERHRALGRLRIPAPGLPARRGESPQTNDGRGNAGCRLRPSRVEAGAGIQRISSLLPAP
jgi:hypothetical protein